MATITSVRRSIATAGGFFSVVSVASASGGKKSLEWSWATTSAPVPANLRRRRRDSSFGVSWISTRVAAWGSSTDAISPHSIAAFRAALYNPGVATVVPWLVPGIWCVAEFNNQNMITASDWRIALR